MPFILLDATGRYCWASKGGWIPLDHPPARCYPALYNNASDAQDVADTLRNQYGFDATVEAFFAPNSKRNNKRSN